MNVNEITLPNEIVHRIDAIFSKDVKKTVEKTASFKANDFDLAKDIRHLLPELPESAEYQLKTLDPKSKETRHSAFHNMLGRLASQKAEFSEGFMRETYTKNLEVIDMAMVQLSAVKRSYLGSIAIGSEQYDLKPKSAVYRLSETYWADLHADYRLDVALVTPAKILFPVQNPLKPAYRQAPWSNKDKLDQLQNLDRLLNTFGF